MRLLILLLMGIIPELALSQPVRTLNLADSQSFSYLKKFSYLIVSIKIDSSGQKRNALTNGTGFFVRQNDSLYLVTARHVLTGYDPYKRPKVKPRLGPPNYIAVWYQSRDTSAPPKYKLIPLPQAIIQQPPFPAHDLPDVYVLNVTGDFDDGKINSIDSLLHNTRGEIDSLSIGDAVVSYGYPDEPKNDTARNSDAALDPNVILVHPNLTPSFSEARSAKMPHLRPRRTEVPMGYYYYSVQPGLAEGISGSPLFKISRVGINKPIVEWIGIQSGTSESQKNSFVVKAVLLPKLYNIK
jgi:hypothetical protein